MWLFLTANDGSGSTNTNTQVVSWPYVQKRDGSVKVQGKLITVHSKKIAINALKDEEEATKIIEWLKREINAAWKDRGEGDIFPYF